MNFGEAIKSVFSKYAISSGRARRSEYWYFALFNFLVGIVLAILGKKFPFLSILTTLYGLAVLIPGITVSVRRLHDIGKSGWFFLVPLIPALAYTGYLIYYVIKIMKETGDNFSDIDAISQHIMNNPSGIVAIVLLGLLAFITWIVWIVWMVKDSQPSENKWGPNPKEQPGTPVNNNNEW